MCVVCCVCVCVCVCVPLAFSYYCSLWMISLLLEVSMYVAATGAITYTDLSPFFIAVGVYETESGNFRLISDGDLPSAVAASCAIPYIFQPVQGESVRNPPSLSLITLFSSSLASFFLSLSLSISYLSLPLSRFLSCSIQ